MNSVIRAVVRRAEGRYGHTVIGIRNGWRGMAEGEITSLSVDKTRGIHSRGGTILGTARFHPDEHDGGINAVKATFRHHRLDAVICIGGDGTLSAAGALAAEGLNVVGVPKTIDNDVVGTDYSVGFDTAVTIATDAIDRVQTTGESHNRVMVVEVMGRHNGWIAVSAGIAGGSEAILIPEDPFDIADIAASLAHRHRSQIRSSVVVVAEGARPDPDKLEWEPPRGPHGQIVPGAIGELVRSQLTDRLSYDCRLTVLGHVQRGGIPTAFDRVLGSRMGVRAVDALHDGETGVMIGQQAEEMVRVPLSEIQGKRKDVPDHVIDVARTLSTV